MAEIIQFPSNEVLIYQCNCGGSIFRFEAENHRIDIVCHTCGSINHQEDVGLVWGK
jgi:hypothetical protein